MKKATRDLSQLLSNIESPMTRLETVHKKYTELLADMKKLDRDYAKSKKRSDQLQKDQDKGKSELNKTVTMKDKLEKLCRELTKENKKVKVGAGLAFLRVQDLYEVNGKWKGTNMAVFSRTKTRNLKTPRKRPDSSLTSGWIHSSTTFKM